MDSVLQGTTIVGLAHAVALVFTIVVMVLSLKLARSYLRAAREGAATSDRRVMLAMNGAILGMFASSGLGEVAETGRLSLMGSLFFAFALVVAVFLGVALFKSRPRHHG